MINHLNGMPGVPNTYVPPSRKRREFRLLLPDGPDDYGDMTGAQRLVVMFAYLIDGGVIHPGEYADKYGISRYAVHGQMNKLIQMNVPVVRTKYGTWMLSVFAKRESSEEENIRALYEEEDTKIGY